MYVEVMGLECTVFDGPVFDRTYLRSDRWLLISFENFLFLSIDGDVELDRAVGPAKFFRKIKLPLRGWLLFVQPGKLNACHRPSRPVLRGRWLLHWIGIADDDAAEFLLQIGIAGRTSGISFGQKTRFAAFGSLHDKLRSPGRRQQDGVLKSRLRERIAIERD